MKVLSLFDGISCGRVALQRANITPASYHASEIDKYAIQISKKNHKDIVHLGDVLAVKDFGKVDLLLGGFPCQSFSFAGKGLNFSDPRGALFFELLRIKRETNPTYFLFENVIMRKEYRDVISRAIGVEPVMIDSALFSAQHRKRYYWTNIPIAPIVDKGILLEDILEEEKVPVIKTHGNLIYKPFKSQCLDANYFKGADNRGQRTGCIQVGVAELNGHDFLKRVYSPKGKSPTLTAISGGNQERKIACDASHWRKLTPVECERLQTLPDNYTEGVSASQRYKTIGNGWTVDVIAHILKAIE